MKRMSVECNTRTDVNHLIAPTFRRTGVKAVSIGSHCPGLVVHDTVCTTGLGSHAAQATRYFPTFSRARLTTVTREIRPSPSLLLFGLPFAVHTQQHMNQSSTKNCARNSHGDPPQAASSNSADSPTSPSTATGTELRRSRDTFKTVAVGTATFLFVSLGVWVLVTARLAIALTVLSFLVAVAMDRGVKAFERWKLAHWMAITFVVLAILGVLAALAFLIVPTAAEQATDLVKSTPHLIADVRNSRAVAALDRVFHIKSELDNPTRKLAQIAKSELAPLLYVVGGVLTAVSGTIVIIFLAIFMLVFGGPLIDRAIAEARLERQPTYKSIVHKVHDAIGGYVCGLVVICSVNATMTTIFLAINRTPFFLPLGLVSGLSSLVPYAGPFLAGVTVSAIALGAGGIGHGIAAALYFIAYGQLEANLLGPLIFRRTVNTNPLLATISILFLGEVAGILGAVAAVPLLAILQIVVGEILQLRRAGWMERRAPIVTGEDRGKEDARYETHPRVSRR
jgi:predicted PurR-regulated permease PerM